jgi:hypothetical protein
MLIGKGFFKKKLKNKNSYKIFHGKYFFDKRIDTNFYFYFNNYYIPI